MQLRTARVCLDCEEVHDAQQCPACASESFAFVTRWVPAPERRARPRPPTPANPEQLETYRRITTTSQPSRWTVVGGGALGLALLGIAGWASKQGKKEKEEDAK